MPSSDELNLLYMEDLRRHYEVGKDFLVKEKMRKHQYLEELTVETRNEMDLTPTTRANGVSCRFGKGMARGTYTCDLYTTIVPVDDSYRYILCLHETTMNQIIFKADVGNIQIDKNIIRVFHQGLYERYHEEKMKSQMTVLSHGGSSNSNSNINTSDGAKTIGPDDTIQEEIECVCEDENLLMRFLGELSVVSFFLPQQPLNSDLGLY